MRSAPNWSGRAPNGTPWKLICWLFGIARASAHRRWRYGLSLIAYRLNGRRLSHLIGMPGFDLSRV
jgi:hypothetical protein